MLCLRLAALLIAGLAVMATAAQAQAPAPAMPPITGPTAPSPLKPGDPFGEQVTLPERTIIYLQGQTNWDSAFDTLVESYKSLTDYMAKNGIKPTGPATTIYTETDDTGFKFRAAFPIAAPPKDPPKGAIAVGPAPSGKALKFVHRGSYDAMESTYEAISNYLDDKQLDPKDVFVEEYQTDILTTTPDALVVDIYVPLK